MKAIEQVVEASLRAIEGSMDGVDLLPPRDAYEECRKADYRGVFVRRLWGFFRERWDQRDDPVLAPVLAAADEVIWSCHWPVVEKLGRDIPAPLAYLTPEFAAHAVGRGNPPQSLQASDRLLEHTVKGLPVPLIGLPYSCVTGPWWLVLVAHEVGHQVAYAIDEIEGTGWIAGLVEAAAIEAGATPELARRWRSWSHEVFADAFAATTVGPGHLWVLVELEQGSDETMIRDLPGYPPPIVRHEMVAALLEDLDLPSSGALSSPAPRLAPGDLAVPAETVAGIEDLFEMVPGIVTALRRAEVVNGLHLDQLTRWDALAFGVSVGWWQEQFRLGTAAPQARLRAARLATVGGLAAWAEIADEPKPEIRRARRDALRAQMLSVVPASREDGYRAEVVEVPSDLAAFADEVARDVLALQIEDETATTSAVG